MGSVFNKTWVQIGVSKILTETGVRQTHVSAKDTIILNQEVEFFFEKEVIEPVPLAELNQGFYSTFFLVPKKTNGQ